MALPATPRPLTPQLEAFKGLANSMGYDPAQVEAFTNTVGAMTGKSSGGGYNPNTDPVLQRQIAFEKFKAGQAGMVDDKGNMITDPVKEVVRQGGGEFLKGLPVSTQKSKAQAILEQGGVEGWRKTIPIDELLPKDKFTKYQSADSLKEDLKTIQQFFPSGTQADVGFGENNLTGPITSRLGFLRNNKQQQAQSLISQMETQKIKELSGVAVSPTEFQRMHAWLPDPKDQENEVAVKTDALLRRIQLQQAVLERSARENIEPGQYLDKHDKELFMEFGFNPNGSDPAADSKGLPKSPKNLQQTSGKFMIEEVQ